MKNTSSNSFLLFAFVFFVLNIFSQANNSKIIFHSEEKPVSVVKNACDCNGAITLDLNKSTSYTLYKNPNGYGEVQEIKAQTSSDKKAFEQEHNTTWYLLNMNYDGDFGFEIMPLDTNNDYDFLLYSFSDSTFCDALLNKRLVPIRSNLSRNNFKAKGITGLKIDAKESFVGKGINESYSKFIHVKKGEKYMLVVDNVNENGKSHSITFNYIKKINITGIVTDFTKQPIEVNISLTDRNEKIIQTTTTNSKTGTYNFTATVKEEDNYILTFYNNSFLPEIKTINTKELTQEQSVFTINKELASLKLGETYNIAYCEKDLFLITNIDRAPIYLLGKLMLDNPRMKIEIQGHATKYELTKNNVTTNGGLKSDQQISDERALYTMQDLISMGVAKNRMKAIGLSSNKMLYPNPKTEEEKNKNKRISIKVLALE